MKQLQQAIAAHQRGDWAHAESLYRALGSRHPEVPHFLGALFLAQGRFDDAIACLQPFVAKAPHLGAYKNLSLAHKRHGQLPQALAVALQGLQHFSSDLALRQSAAHLAWALGDWAQCAMHFEHALRLSPKDASLWLNLGNARIKQDLGGDAILAFEHALALQPDLFKAWLGMAVAHHQQQDLAMSRHWYQRLLDAQQDTELALTGLGHVAVSAQDHRLALNWFQQALSVNPQSADAWYGLGMAQSALALMEDARVSLGRCHALNPWHKQVLGHYVHAKMQCADWSGLDALLTQLQQGLEKGVLCVDPFVLMTVCADEALLRLGTERYVQSVYPARPRQWPRAVRSGGRLRVGYVSGEFRQHATSILMIELWEQHKAHADLVAFDNGGSDGSAMRQRIEQAFDDIVDIRAMSDEQAAHAVVSHGIDVLINLNGFFGSSRTGLFSLRPAPVQVNYLGFPGTMGAPYMDVVFADEQVIPPASERHFTEQVVHVGPCYQPRDQRARPKVRVARHETGLPDGAFVYCCFNRTYKITPTTWATWMRILSQVPGSVLWLLADTDACSDRLRQAAQAQGVDPSRLVFAQRWPHERHLARHALADLFLDTLPCNAHTTAADALLAGLPVLTCEGTTFAGRVAQSLLAHHGLSHWVARDWASYEALACRAAGELRHRLLADRQSLAQVRQEDYTPYFAALQRVHAAQRQGQTEDK